MGHGRQASASPAAIDRIYKQIVGDGAGFPGAGTRRSWASCGWITPAQSRRCITGTPIWAHRLGQIATKGDKGDQGIQGGIPGPPPGLQSPAADAINVPLKAGNVLGDATATVTADGGGDLKFSFGIPVGKTGAKGDTSDPVVISQDTQPTFGDDVVWFNTVNAKAYSDTPIQMVISTGFASASPGQKVRKAIPELARRQLLQTASSRP